MPLTPRQRSFSYFLAESNNERGVDVMPNSALRKSAISVSEIVTRYEAGESTASIAKDAGVSDRQIRRLLNREGVKMRPAGKPPVHDVNTDFFKRWSPEMAYVLGFIVTDGCVSGNQLSIAQKEREILDKIARVTGATSPITVRKNNGGKTIIHALTISRQEVVQDLQRYGITPRKSCTVPFPDVPEKYLPHFLRGVIDGDGWIHEKGYRMSVVSASLLFAERLVSILLERGFNARLMIDNSGKSTYYRAIVSGKDDVRRLGEWLYRDCGDLYLTRKRERFEYHNAS
jgi:hypothetical protein